MVVVVEPMLLLLVLLRPVAVVDPIVVALLTWMSGPPFLNSDCSVAVVVDIQNTTVAALMWLSLAVWYHHRTELHTHAVLYQHVDVYAARSTCIADNAHEHDRAS